MCVWDEASWQVLFYGEHRTRVRFVELFWIRLAGEAVNNVTPFIDIGGEPLKVHLVKRRFGIPLSAAVTSTLAAKTSILIAEAFFMFAGAFLSFWVLPLSGVHRLEMGALLLAVCSVFALFLFLQQKGVFHKVNPEIGLFYKKHGDLFWKGVGLNFIGWVLGGVELFFFARLAGVELRIFEALVLEAVIQLVRTGGFFIPMSLGIQEGGMAFFIGLCGHDPAAGVALSLLKRLRQLVWTAAGFGSWGIFQYAEARKRSVLISTDALLSFDTKLDRCIHRPVAEVLALILSKTPVSPNQVTVLTLVPAALACAFFSLGTVLSSVIGIFFFYLWSVLDHADGSLARLKKQTSAWGRILDDAFDVIASTLVLLGVFWGLEGLWARPDRDVIGRWFYIGLVLNALSGVLVVLSKRESRSRAVTRKNAPLSFIWRQKILDRLTGRDAFYGFLILIAATHGLGRSSFAWYTFSMGFLIISLYAVSAVAFWESARKYGPRSGS